MPDALRQQFLDCRTVRIADRNGLALDVVVFGGIDAERCHDRVKDLGDIDAANLDLRPLIVRPTDGNSPSSVPYPPWPSTSGRNNGRGPCWR